MNKDTIMAEIENVIVLLKEKKKLNDEFKSVYKSFLSIYEDAYKKLKKSSDYKCEDLSGRTSEYVTIVTEEKADKELVEAFWKVESLMKVLYRQN
jgi:hypothetical protein